MGTMKMILIQKHSNVGLWRNFLRYLCCRKGWKLNFHNYAVFKYLRPSSRKPVERNQQSNQKRELGCRLEHMQIGLGFVFVSCFL